MAAKLGIAEEEADESQYWLELLVASGDLKLADVKDLHVEFNELTAILVASRKTLRRRIQSVGSVIRERQKSYGENGPDISPMVPKSKPSNRHSKIKQ